MAETRSIPRHAIEHLRGADSALDELIERYGVLEYNVEPDLWRSVVGSIVGQQLSVRAAATIRGRVAALGGDGFPPPDLLLALPDERLRACGLSRAKTSYVRDAARCWTAGEVDVREIEALDDEAVIERLVRIRGVGRWTAEMVLLFCLGRPDVLAVDDLGIRAAAQKVYGLSDRPTKEELNRIGAPWSPFRSYASLYLWRSLAG